MFEKKKYFSCPKQIAHVQDKSKPSCPKAHNPLELELIAEKKKIKNLKGVIKVSSDQRKDNKALQAWIPANSRLVDDIACFQPYIEKLDEEVKDDDAGEDEAKKSIFKRENLYKDMEDDKE